MLSRKLIKAWLISVAILAVALLFGSCAKKIEGPEVVNNPPKIEIVNIPPDNSHFTTNPQIYWFGTDVDGKIVKYEYAVVPVALLLAAHIDTSSQTAILAYAADSSGHISEPRADRDCKPESCWQQIDVETADNPNRQTIRLFADKDPTVNIVQYFYVRAVDNDSTRSNIDYRLYSRTNHPPDTEIKTRPDTSGYFDLYDTTITYKGIYFEWKGTDIIDYPEDSQNPEFEYFYQVFGPYQKDEIFGMDTTGAYAFDYTKVVPTEANKLVLTSQDSISPSNVWVTKTSARIYGLWTNQPPSDTTRSGYFVLKVTARDDAFVSDTLPAYLPFFTIDAHFENDLLVYVPFFCVNSDQLGEIRCDSLVDTMFAFYKRVIANAGYDSNKVLLSPGRGDARNRPTKLELAKHRVYLMIDDGSKSNLVDTNFNDVTPYLDMGGNVWVWAVNPLGAFYVASVPTLASLTTKPVPTLYFDVIGEYYGGWAETYKNRWKEYGKCPDPDTCPPLPPTNEEFLGGLVVGSSGMPNFDVDPAKYSSTYIIFPLPTVDWVGAPHTNYFQRYAYSEPLWLFKSYYGDAYTIPDSMKAYVTGLQGRVVGLRYDSGLFKTAIYGFSMYMLPEDQATDIFAKSMDWFLQDK